MTKTKARTVKPDCDEGTPCGNSCISKADNCTAVIAASIAGSALAAIKSAAKDAADSKAEAFGTAAATALSFTFPMDLAADGDVVISVVSSSLTYMAHKVIAQVQKRRSRMTTA